MSIINEAAGIIEERRESYGDPLPNHERIAAFWSVVFGHPVKASQVVQCMRLVKESRLIETPGHRDSLIDICGYADCEAVIMEAIHANPHSPPDVGSAVRQSPGHANK